MSEVKIIRSYWGNRENTLQEIPYMPFHKNEVVYVWGKKNWDELRIRGYNVRFVEEETSPFANDLLELIYERKLIALDLALKEFGEVILLDWDCYILRPLDNEFYKELRKKPIQCPLYAQHKDCYNALYEIIPENHPWFQDPKEHKHLTTHLDVISRGFLKWNWEFEEGLISPNFGFFYSSDVTIGKKLIDIAVKNNMEGCVEEHAMFVYADCSLDEYIEKYHPTCLLGVSDEVVNDKTRIGKIQGKFNNYIKSNLKMNLYYEHI